VIDAEMLLLSAHELREEAYERNEAGHRRCHFFVCSVDFEALIVEDDASTVGCGNGVETQR
jgi:hypothetical protein